MCTSNQLEKLITIIMTLQLNYVHRLIKMLTI